MNETTITAAAKVIFQRWPWPDGSEEIAEDYVNRLRLAVSDWRGPRIAAFKRAASDIAGDPNRFGRPSVEDIVLRALNFCDEGGSPAIDENPEAVARRAAFLAVRSGLVDRRIPVNVSMEDLRKSVPGALDRDLRSAWSGLVVVKTCRCGFGIAVRAGEKMRFVRAKQNGAGIYERQATYHECLGCHRVTTDERRYPSCEMG